MPPVLTLSDDLAGLGALSEWSTQLSTLCQAGERDRYRIELVLTEAVTNAMMYGSNGIQSLDTTLEASREGGSLQVTIVDNGVAFDPLTAATKALPRSLEEASPGGLGLVFIRSYTDAATYERRDDKNRLSLVFVLGAPPKPSSAV